MDNKPNNVTIFRNDNENTAIDFVITTLEKEGAEAEAVREEIQEALNKILADGKLGNNTIVSGYFDIDSPEIGKYQWAATRPILSA